MKAACGKNYSHLKLVIYTQHCRLTIANVHPYIHRQSHSFISRAGTIRISPVVKKIPTAHFNNISTPHCQSIKSNLSLNELLEVLNCVLSHLAIKKLF